MLPRTLTTLRVPKPVAIAAATLLLVGVVGLWGIPRLFDGSRQGQALALQLAEATGQRVRIEGAVKVGLWPRPHIAINQLVLSRVGSNDVLLSAPRVDFNVTLGSLISGDYTVKDIHLVRPDITVPAGFKLHTSLEALPVRQISVSSAKITLQGTFQPEVLSEVSGTIHLPDETTLIQAQLNGQWRGAPALLDIDMAPLDNTGASMMRLALEAGAAETSFHMSGLLGLVGEAASNAQFDLKAGQGTGLWALLSSLGLLPTAPSDTGLLSQLTMTASLTGTRSAYDIKDIKLALGTWQMQGMARYVTGTAGGVSVAVQTSPLDLANWPTLSAWGKEGNFVIPAKWLGAFDLKLAALKWGELTTGEVALKGDVKNGALTLASASATLPGDSRLAFAGQIKTAAESKAQVEGKLNLETLQLRSLLTSLGYELPASFDQAALRQLKAAIDLRGPWMSLTVPNLAVTLDGIEATGQLAARADSGVYDVTLKVGQLELEKYAQAKALPAWLWQLPASNFNITFRQLRAGDKMAENVNLSASLANQRLTINSLTAADFGGNTVRLSGTTSADPAQNSDLTLRLISPDFAQLRNSFAPVTRLLPEMLSSKLAGAVDLSVRFRHTAGESQQLSSLALGGEGRVDVVTTAHDGQPLRFKVRVQNRETAAVLRQIMPGLLSRPDAVLGLLDVYAEGVALDAERWQLSSVQGQVAGVSLRSGDLELVTSNPMQVSGQLEIGNASIDLWRQTLDPVKLSSALSGNVSINAAQMTLSNETLSKVTGQLSFGPPGKVALGNVKGTWREGSFTASGELAMAPQLTLKGNVDIKEANLAMRGGNRFGLSGIVDLSLRVEGQGADQAELISSLSGDGEISVDSGELSGLDLAALSEALQDKRHPADLTALMARSGKGSLSSFGGDFVIDEGVVRAAQLRLRTPVASADVKADLDLSGPHLAAQATTTLREMSGAPAFVVSLNGAPSALDAVFDTAALSQYIKDRNAPPAPAKPDEPKKEDASDKPAASADKPADKPANDSMAVIPPEEPVPPSADEPVAKPVNEDPKADAPKAAPKDESEAPARSNINRSTAASRETQRSATAAKPVASAPRRAPSSSNGGPPSIGELLAEMPALNSSAQAVVEAARTPQPAATPAITFNSVDDAPPPAAAPARPRVQQAQLAPEFDGVAPKTTSTREVKTQGLTIRMPEVDVVGRDDNGAAPASSVDALLKRSED